MDKKKNKQKLVGTTAPQEPKHDRYLNPFTDFGFKKLFGEEINKELLLDFLNELLSPQEGRITELTYSKTEHLGSLVTDRRAVFDLYCTNERGERFIVEMQKSKQIFFKDRTVYYSTFPIQEQAQRSAKWDYQLKAVYLVAILDFIFEEDKAMADKYRYDVKLTDIDTAKVFYDKLTFVYLEMPKFKKEITELSTHFDKWMYVLQNLSKLQERPPALQERIFDKLFATAEIAKFTQEELIQYEDSLKYYRDLKNSLDTAREEGINEGEKRGAKKVQIATARAMVDKRIAIDIISDVTGLTPDEIKKLTDAD